MGKTAAGLFVTLAAGVLLFGLASPADASTTIGIEYEHANNGGDDYIKTVTPNGYVCTSSRSVREAGTSNLPSYIDNEISSFTNFSNCFTKHYENNNYGGASTPYQDGQNISGAMNDATDSVAWS
jgi:hypothetical protein